MVYKVDETTPSPDFANFIDDSFVDMCRSRGKTKHTVEYDDEKKELIFHYADGTADRVQIVPVEGYKPTKEVIEMKDGDHVVILANN